MKISLVALSVLLLSNFALANICFDFKNYETDHYTFKDDLLINSFDNTELAANIFHPKDYSQKYPTVIFVNSWTLEDHEYYKQAKILAAKGYIVLSYSTRGFGCSGGKIDVIGEKDMNDLSNVIDWLEQNTRVDINNIGIAGISYGGGMALMALGKEPRVKTGVSMSGWSSLTSALYDNNTPRMFWTSLLIGLGFLTGELDEMIPQMFKNLLTQKDIEKTVAWAEARSPINYIDEVNSRNAPVFISQNYGDNLFQPNPLIKYFNKLTTPKIMDINQGIHASAEVTGMFRADNYTFNRMQMWFDYWLKGIKNKNLKLNKINIQTDLEHKRESYTENELSSLETVKWHFHPERLLGLSNLKKSSYNDGVVSDFLISQVDTLATTGIPLLSSLVDGAFKVPVYSYIPMISNMHSFTFKSQMLDSGQKIRGIPKVKLNIKSSEDKYQLIAYLYDVNKYGKAKLITHGAFSTLSGEKNVEFELVATAYDIPKNHRVALVIDTKDSLYAPVSRSSQVIEIKFSEGVENSITYPVK